jgi:hypothetical protein
MKFFLIFNLDQLNTFMKILEETSESPQIFQPFTHEIYELKLISLTPLYFVFSRFGPLNLKLIVLSPKTVSFFSIKTTLFFVVLGL